MTAAALLLILASSQAPQADTFPHATHRRLFTTCAPCHAGIVAGDSATARPSPTYCAQCHDGTLQRRVTWTPRAARPTILRYDHPTHITRVAAAGDSALACARCHALPDATVLMAVGPARPELCITCHAHQAPSHLAQASCTQCHRPLAETPRVAAAAISRFSRPANHDSSWVRTHRASATSGTCATCHAREFCASCHVNARSVDAITALPSDARVAALMRGRLITYPRPASHADAGFIREHGPAARTDATRCANCHARNSCLDCHRAEERVPALAALPERQRGGAPGVDLSGNAPPDHGPGFALRHRVIAAGGDASCSRCHAPTFCSSCHDGATSPGFHGGNFVQRHSASAYGAENECSVCHQTESFCRDCHRMTGRASTGALPGRYHDAQPLWTFAHSAVARRSLETCASCHRQTDCMRCHSATRGWGVSPHGPGFNAELGNRNPAMCRTCHLTGPPR